VTAGLLATQQSGQLHPEVPHHPLPTAKHAADVRMQASVIGLHFSASSEVSQWQDAAKDITMPLPHWAALNSQTTSIRL